MHDGSRLFNKSTISNEVLNYARLLISLLAPYLGWYFVLLTLNIEFRDASLFKNYVKTEPSYTFNFIHIITFFHRNTQKFRYTGFPQWANSHLWYRLIFSNTLTSLLNGISLILRIIINCISDFCGLVLRYYCSLY